MSALLYPIIEIGAALFVEENDQLARCQTVLRSAEAKDFYAGSPGDFFRCSSKCRDRIRETRSIHVQTHPPLVCECSNLANLIRNIHRSHFRRLLETDY